LIMERNHNISDNARQVLVSDTALVHHKRLSTPLVYKSDKTIAQHAMISTEDALLVGVSGGSDSVALLLLLLDIIQCHALQNSSVNKHYKSHKHHISHYLELNQSLIEKDISSPALRIGVAHINHSLRGAESDRDEAFVINLAGKYNLPCYTLRVDVPAVAKEQKLSFEEAARNIRYAFYKEVVTQHSYTKIALGHNSDDNAELLLMNLLRGSGTRGISGIPPVRDSWIIRPLIDVSRQEILEYLKLKQQPYVLDSSNSDTSYLRNRIRHFLIPQLQNEYNPSVTEALNRLSHIIMDEESWMEAETERIFSSAKISSADELLIEDALLPNRDGMVYDKKRELHLDLYSFADLHPALAKRLVRRAIEDVKGDLKRITLRHIDDILSLISSKVGNKHLHLPDRILIIKRGKTICFRQESKPLRELNMMI